MCIVNFCSLTGHVIECNNINEISLNKTSRHFYTNRYNVHLNKQRKKALAWSSQIYLFVAEFHLFWNNKLELICQINSKIAIKFCHSWENFRSPKIKQRFIQGILRKKKIRDLPYYLHFFISRYVCGGSKKSCLISRRLICSWTSFLVDNYFRSISTDIKSCLNLTI